MLKNDEEWITKDGKKIMVGDMTEKHAKNCLRLMLRRVRKYKRSKHQYANDMLRDEIKSAFGDMTDFWK